MHRHAGPRCEQTFPDVVCARISPLLLRDIGRRSRPMGTTCSASQDTLPRLKVSAYRKLAAPRRCLVAARCDRKMSVAHTFPQQGPYTPPHAYNPPYDWDYFCQASLIRRRLEGVMRNNNVVLEALTTAIVALDNAPVPHDIDHMKRFLAENYSAQTIAIFLARATMRLHPARPAKDVCVEFAITEPVLVKK
ncbi:hypothetical protein [Rhodoplanes sp. Z2-YC6860]|uniref:hypothetical protein n=1 Tax=Rhodoplanes sp. Z2-YC6860 TaxID=674703 RepID=UPI0012EE344F|nr:hypothetical protein [Rhodoplanes sp. Z2-YC6860]